MSDLIYPTVDVFLYDLRDGLGQNQGEVDANWQGFRAKLPQRLEGVLKGDRAFDAEYVEMLGDRRVQTFGGQPGDCFEGFYYPVRQGDTYGLLLDCSVKDRQHPQPTNWIKAIKAEINCHVNVESATLGKSWVIYGTVPSDRLPNVETIARKCYGALLPDRDWETDLKGRGMIQGAEVFELWNIQVNLPERLDEHTGDRSFCQTPINSSHVTIILYPNAEIAEAVSQLLNFEWMRLWNYRNKILWSYGQTRQLKQWLKRDYITIESGIKQLRQSPPSHQTLRQLELLLDRLRQTFSHYAIDLGYLGDFHETIAINLDNYNQRVQEINHLLDGLPFQGDRNNHLNYLQQFSEDVNQKMLRQLQKERSFFRNGLNNLEISIETVRTWVELERTKGDRHFQNHVAIWGIGLAAGSVVASISEQFPIVVVPVTPASEENSASRQPLGSYLSDLGVQEPWLTPAISTVLTLVTSLGFAALTGLAIKLWPRSR
jgi:hypothetical protein